MKRVHMAGMVAVILALVTCTCAVSAATLKAESLSLPTVGSQGEVPITLYSADAGISGYMITITTSNPNVAQIVEAKVPAWIDLNYGSVMPAAGGFTIKVVDITEQISAPGNAAAGYRLGSVVVEGKTRGASTDLLVTVVQMDADDGTVVNPTVVNGLIGVELIPGKIQVNTVGTTGAAIQGATIILDNTPKTRTPSLIEGVIPGKHRVRVTYPPTYVDSEEKEVTVVSGATSPVTFTLTRTGSFRVYSKVGTTAVAGAAILVNGASTSKTTVTTGTIISGYDPALTYLIRVEMAGYAGAEGLFKTTPAGTKVVSLTMPAGGNVIPGYLSVDSVPELAKVYVDGQNTGSDTSALVMVDPGEHTVYVTLEGYETPEAWTGQVAEGATVELMFELKEKPFGVPEFPTLVIPLVSLLGLSLVVILARARKDS